MRQKDKHGKGGNVKKILYILIISFLLIGTEQLAEYLIGKNESLVSDWACEYLTIFDNNNRG